jgi:hypothetical protein
MNENPVVQVVLIGLLLLVVGFLLMTRVFSAGDETSTSTEGAETSPEAADAVADAEAADASAATGAAEAGAGAPPTAASGTIPGEFAAGPGLPGALVTAYERGDTVVLLVTRATGTDDRRMRAIVNGFRGHDGVAVFTTTAKYASDYARITEGVDLDRTPALVVISPKDVSEGPVPEASVSYAYRSSESVAQAIRDAGYKGPQLPYHPK